MVDAALATGLLAFAVAPLILRVARASTKVLTIQRTLTRVLGVVNALDSSRPDLVDVQIPLLTFSTSSLALLGTAAHRLVTNFGTSGGGWVLRASNLFRMFAVRQFLHDLFLTSDGPQVLEKIAECDENSDL